jgi:hypothetical protein
MAENLNLQLTVDTSGATTSVGSLKKQLREAQNEVMTLADKFGATSKEAIEAAKRAGELKDRIGDAKALTDAFNPDAKFKSLTASLSGVAGAFGAIQGAMALFGVESEDVQKTLLKVQSAMAISQGLQSVGESIDSFRQLGAVIQSTTVYQKANAAATQAAGVIQKLFTGSVDTTTAGFKNLKVAMAATGIGLLVVAVGYLIANFDELKNSLFGASAETKAYNAVNEQAVKTSGELIVSETALIEKVKKGGLTKQEQIHILNEWNSKHKDTNLLFNDYNKLQQYAINSGPAYIEYIKAKAKADANYSLILLKQKELLEVEVKSPEEFRKFQDYFSDQAIFGRIGDIDKYRKDVAKYNINKEIDALAAQTDKLSTDAENAAKKAKVETTEKFVPTTTTDKKGATTRDQELEKERERLKKIEDQILQDELDAFIKRNEQRKKLGLEAVGLDGLTDKERAQKKEDDDKRKAADEKRNQEFTEESNKNGLGKILAIRAAAIVAEQKQDEDNLAAKRRLAELEIENKQETSYAIADIVSGLSGIIGQNTAEGKAIAIASATIDTYLAASTIFKQAAKNPITTINPAYPYLMAAPAILSGIARVKQIASVQVPKGGGGGGGGNMPSMSSAAPMSPQTPQAQTTNISQQSINQMGNQAVRAYVIETDVTSNQQRVESIKQRARFS